MSTDNTFPSVDHTVVVERTEDNNYNFYRRPDGFTDSFGTLIASIEIPGGVKWAVLNLKENYGIY